MIGEIDQGSLPQRVPMEFGNVVPGLAPHFRETRLTSEEECVISAIFSLSCDLRSIGALLYVNVSILSNQYLDQLYQGSVIPGSLYQEKKNLKVRRVLRSFADENRGFIDLIKLDDVWYVIPKARLVTFMTVEHAPFWEQPPLMSQTPH